MASAHSDEETDLDEHKLRKRCACVHGDNAHGWSLTISLLLRNSAFARQITPGPCSQLLCSATVLLTRNSHFPLYPYNRRSSFSGETLFVKKDSTLTTEDVKHDVDDLPAGFREQAYRWCTGHIATWQDLNKEQFSISIVRYVLCGATARCLLAEMARP